MTNVAQDMATKSQDADAVAALAEGGAKKKKVDLVFWLSITWLVVLLIFVILGDNNPLVPDPDLKDRDLINAAPTWSSPMGNTSFGESVFAQTVVGGRISIFIATMVTAIGIVVGGGLGLLAGYLKGWVDGVIRLVINVTLSVPALLLVIFIVVVRGRSTGNIILAVSLLAIPALARIMRASTLQVADREFVKASEVLGVRRGAILIRDVLPNVMPTLLSFAFLTTGIVLVAESSLAFLGLGPIGETSWGTIIAQGRSKFADAPHVVFGPAIVLFLTVLALNLAGDRLLKRFDIRESGI